jgi:hypothetical protein
LGPTQYLNLSLTGRDLTITQALVSSSFFIMGIVQVFVFIPIIPEMLERMQVAYNIVEGEDEALDNSLNDIVNDAYGVFYAAS